MKIVDARMKIIRDALPNIAIIFLTRCWPTKAANVATAMKNIAVSKIDQSDYIETQNSAIF